MLAGSSTEALEDFRTLFRPQREWGEGRGLLLVLAWFLSSVGAGTWIFSTSPLFDVHLGLAVALAILVGGSGSAHLAFLGRPERFWRIIWRPQTSWISRGLLGIIVMTPPALLYLLPAYFPATIPWRLEDPLGRAWLVLSLLAAFWVTMYKGFVLGFAKGIPFWNSPLMPPIFVANALRGGLAILLLTAAVGGEFEGFKTAEATKLWVVVSTAALVFFYVWVMTQGELAARRSAWDLLLGRVALSFYAGAVAIGFLVPLVGGSLAFFTELPRAAVGAIGLCSLVGDFYVIYAMARAGVWRPLVVGSMPATGPASS